MVWSKKSRFRKHCRERAKFTLKYKTRTKLGIENKRKICPYHDKKQHRACARLETCPDDYVSRARCGTRKRGPPQDPDEDDEDDEDDEESSSAASSCGSAVAAAVAQETFTEQTELNVAATQAERPPTPLTPPDEVVDCFMFPRDEDDPDPDPHPESYGSPSSSTRSWARFEHGNTSFFRVSGLN